LVALGGCGRVCFQGPTAATGDAAAQAACDPLPFEPLRYQQIGASGQPLGVTRTLCEQLGLDVIAFDDGDSLEIANELTGATAPYWTSATLVAGAWVNGDGCAPYLPWAPGEPNPSTINSCSLMSSAGLVASDCTIDHYASLPLNMLCEAPRPSVACQQQATQRMYRVAATSDTFANAQIMCSGGEHVVEIDSSAELAAVQQLAGGAQFWIGATLANGRWTTITGCPAVYPWATGEPTVANGGCEVYGTGGTFVTQCGNTATVICETNS
jgi:hypothetical protein